MKSKLLKLSIIQEIVTMINSNKDVVMAFDGKNLYLSPASDLKSERPKNETCYAFTKKMKSELVKKCKQKR